MNSKKGQFLTIEGSEGVGKSTNIAFIRDYLQQRGIDLLVTREPGGTPLSEEIRHLLLKKSDEMMDPTAELLLMFAARSQHINTVILPAINAGQWVLCDRFTDSTYAYQGSGRGLSKTLIEQLEQMVQGDIQPDLTLYLDIDVQIGLERAGKRAELDRFESEKIDFFERVRAGYLERVAAYPERCKVIDAAQALDCVQRDIAEILSEMLS